VRKLIIENVVKPALHRIGTMSAAVLLIGGEWLCANLNACGLVTAGGAATVMQYVVAVALVGVDLVLDWMDKRKASANV